MHIIEAALATNLADRRRKAAAPTSAEALRRKAARIRIWRSVLGRLAPLRVRSRTDC